AVDATSKDIRRYRARAHAAGTLTPEVERMLDDLQRDPHQRIVQELFAPWRADPSAAPTEDTTTDPYEKHDRAVAAHRTALDIELDGGDTDLLVSAWMGAVEQWAAMLEDDGVWGRLRERVAAIADPRLTEADVDRLRADLPDQFLAINARLAADGHDPGRQRGLMKHFAATAGLAPTTVDAALARTVQDRLDRVEKACDDARDKSMATGRGGLDIVSELDAEVREDLTRVRQVLGDEHPATVRVLDRVAETYRRCTVQHLNASGKIGDPAALPHLRTALQLAASSDVKNRVRKNLAAVEEAVDPLDLVKAQLRAEGNTPLLERIERVEKACAIALAKSLTTGAAGLDCVSELDTRLQEDLAQIRRALGDEHPATAGLRDRVAETYRLCIVQRLSTPVGIRDYPAAVPHLRTALQLAASSDVKDRVRKDLATVEATIGFAPDVRVRVPQHAYRPAAVQPEPVRSPAPSVVWHWFFIVVGTAALVAGLEWLRNAPVSLGGFLVLWFALLGLGRRLAAREDLLGWSWVGAGAVLTIIGNVLWGGMWFIALGVATLIGGAVHLDAARGGVPWRTRAWGCALTTYLLALGLAASGGWQAYACAFWLAVITVLAFFNASRDTLLGPPMAWLSLTVFVVGFTVLVHIL
ncbi:MAG TPA: hypothetical protein VKZ89_09315, partial [Thermobifida alba]|nr:hypothetical protein [Thermobifida alba]